MLSIYKTNFPFWIGPPIKNSPYIMAICTEFLERKREPVPFSSGNKCLDRGAKSKGSGENHHCVRFFLSFGPKAYVLVSEAWSFLISFIVFTTMFISTTEVTTNTSICFKALLEVQPVTPSCHPGNIKDQVFLNMDFFV